MVVRGEIERMIGTGECGLQIAQQGIGGAKLASFTLAVPPPVMVRS